MSRRFQNAERGDATDEEPKAEGVDWNVPGSA